MLKTNSLVDDNIHEHGEQNKSYETLFLITLLQTQIIAYVQQTCLKGKPK